METISSLEQVKTYCVAFSDANTKGCDIYYNILYM